MNIEHIRAFLEVTSTGSFQLAAEQLKVTQSTVSARIKSLEERLRQQLFHRKRNGVVLTTGGHQFHSSAVRIVRAWEEGQQVASLPEGLSSLISIGIEENHCSLLMPLLLDQFADAMPNVATTMLVEPSNLLMAKLRAGLLDVAVLYDPQHCAEASVEFLLQDELVMYSTTKREVEDGIVPGYVFVDWGDTFRALHGAHFPGVFSHKLTLRHASDALDHILNRGGSGYFIKRQAEPLVAKGRIFPVDHAPVFQRALFVAARNDDSTPDLMASAVDAIRAAVV